ncbi:EamA family transporter [Agathobaculum butyriciproducens]|uniref:DMT family transporter n=1 Tax=Agathobaculum butyriciproducens TaxID=1628085 RepID=A0AAW4W176_9FIRM|nr:DMT family transporter [Agathobaculum butyriciproducens]MEE0032545.1 EamA family transporter [Agathobaculum butyriciproducens]
MNRKKGIYLLVLTSILWSFSGVCTKFISWNGFAVAGIRGLIAALLLLIVNRRPRLPRSGFQVAAIFSYVGLVVLLILSTKLTTAANAILLQYTAPIYSAILGYFVLKEPVTRHDITVIVLVLIGLAVFLYDGLADGRMAGNLIALLSGVCYGAMNVFMRKCDKDAPADNIFWGNLLAFVLMLPFMGRPEITAVNIGIILFMGIFQLGLAYILYSIAIPHVPALEATIITVLEPILNPVWVMLFYGEKPGIRTIIGGAIVLLAISGKDVLRKLQTLAVLSKV